MRRVAAYIGASPTYPFCTDFPSCLGPTHLSCVGAAPPILALLVGPEGTTSRICAKSSSAAVPIPPSLSLAQLCRHWFSSPSFLTWSCRCYLCWKCAHLPPKHRDLLLPTVSFDWASGNPLIRGNRRPVYRCKSVPAPSNWLFLVLLLILGSFPFPCISLKSGPFPAA